MWDEKENISHVEGFAAEIARLTRDIPQPIAPVELRPGDIVLFRRSDPTLLEQYPVMMWQSLAFLPNGHYDTTHSAICVGVDDSHGPLIAHIDMRNGFNGYFREPLSAKLGESNRTFFVFRPVDPDLAEKLVEAADHPENYESFSWSFFSACRNPWASLPAGGDQFEDGQKSYTTSTNCAIFVAESLRRSAPHLQPRIHSTQTPKAIESWLWQAREHFEKRCYPGQDPYQTLIDTLWSLIGGMVQKNDMRACRSANAIIRVFYAAQCLIDEQGDGLNDIQKCIALLSRVLPALESNNRFSLCGSGPASVVKNKARRLGIFESDIALVKKNNPDDVDQLARHALKKQR